MGFPVTVSMNLGMLVGWAVLSPISKRMGWAPGPVSSTISGARGWIVREVRAFRCKTNHQQLWIALSIMIAESIISLLPITIHYMTTQIRRRRRRSSGLKDFRQNFIPRETNVEENNYFDSPEDDEDPEHEPPDRLVPTRWVWWGLGLSAILCVVLVWFLFGADGIHPWATAVGLVLASVLSLIGVRALGETDLNPVSKRSVM